MFYSLLKGGMAALVMELAGYLAEISTNSDIPDGFVFIMFWSVYTSMHYYQYNYSKQFIVRAIYVPLGIAFSASAGAYVLALALNPKLMVLVGLIIPLSIIVSITANVYLTKNIKDES